MHTSKHHLGCVWWYMLVIPALGRLRQEDCKFEASLSYTMKPCLKKTHKKKKGKRKTLVPH
jgi:hypothetical protein